MGKKKKVKGIIKAESKSAKFTGAIQKMDDGSIRIIRVGHNSVVEIILDPSDVNAIKGM